MRQSPPALGASPGETPDAEQAMSLRINNNTAALNGHRNMVKNDAEVSKALERLSSGLRINRASDDAAGLIISEQMRAQLAGLSQAIDNSQQAVTMVQTAEGALDEVSNLLTKARTLAIHAGNAAVNDTNQLMADQSELDNIVDSVDRIALNTQFGTKRILNGSLSNGLSNNSAVQSVKLGGDYSSLLTTGAVTKGYHTLNITQQATQTSSILSMANSTDIWTAGSLASAVSTDVVQSAFSMSINGANLTVSSGTTKAQFLQQLNAVGSQVGFTVSVSGAAGSGNLNFTATNYGSSFTFDVQFVSGASGASTMVNTANVGLDATATLYLYTGAAGANGTATSGATQTIVFSATGGSTYPGGSGLRMVSSGGSAIVLSTAVGSGFIYGAVNGTSSGATFQIGANVDQTATVELPAVDASNLGVGGSGTYSSLTQLKGSSLISGNSNEALKVIDKAIDDVTKIRGELGAFQSSTLETNINSLQVTNENLTTAESTIRDVDFAGESANFTKYNILMQASTSMMAQANQLPQNVLKLLQ
jgi:flagellin